MRGDCGMASRKEKEFIRLQRELKFHKGEWLNILNGFGGRDYVNKYHRIRHQIPLIISKDKIVEDDDME